LKRKIITKNKKSSKVLFRTFSMFFLFIFSLSCSLIIFNDNDGASTFRINTQEVNLSGSKFYPIIRFGHDEKNDVHGIWFITEKTGNIRAFYSRDPNTGCNISLRNDIKIKKFNPVFASTCNDTFFTENGSTLSSNQNKNLDEFTVMNNGDKLTIDITTVKYGICSDLSNLEKMNSTAQNLRCSTVQNIRFGQPKYGKGIGLKY
jgi:hypothetical protein